MFEIRQKWIVTKDGASDAGWSWVEENDVFEVESVQHNGETAALISDYQDFISADWETDVEEFKLLVPYIETDLEA
jgi:hypothetical protein